MQPAPKSSAIFQDVCQFLQFDFSHCFPSKQQCQSCLAQMSKVTEELIVSRGDNCLPSLLATGGAFPSQSRYHYHFFQSVFWLNRLLLKMKRFWGFALNILPAFKTWRLQSTVVSVGLADSLVPDRLTPNIQSSEVSDKVLLIQLKN